MKTLVCIFLGGGTGSVVRFLVQQLVNKSIVGSHFPAATFIINIIGSFMIGMLFSVAARFNLSYETKLMLIVGFCGGFTTFSAFSSENLNLLKSGMYGTFLVYTLLSVFMGAAFASIGIWMGKNLF